MKAEDGRRRRWNGRRNGGEYSAKGGKNLSGVGGGFGVLKHKGRLMIGQGLVGCY